MVKRFYLVETTVAFEGGAKHNLLRAHTLNRLLHQAYEMETKGNDRAKECVRIIRLGWDATSAGHLRDGTHPTQAAARVLATLAVLQMFPVEINLRQLRWATPPQFNNTGVVPDTWCQVQYNASGVAGKSLPPDYADDVHDFEPGNMSCPEAGP